MTPIQIVAAGVFVVAAAWAYIPSLLAKVKVPAKSPSLLLHIEQVVGIRDSYKTPEVTGACNTLLSVLLQVKP
jgi:hypothetical protein